MATCRLYDRAGMTTATTGTGTVTLGSAISNTYFSFNAAGVVDGIRVRYVIDDGTDFEIGEGVYTASGTTLTRATVIRSNIAGVQGTSLLNLSGSATVRIDASRTDLVASYMFGQQFSGMVNGVISPSVSANALTLAVKTLNGDNPSAFDPVIFVFRNSTLANGDYNVYRVTAALSIVVTSTATLGHVSARDQQIILYAIDNAGTIELAVATKLFDQSARLVSTTIMNGSSTSAAVMYSTTARTSVPWYPIARCVSNQTTAGTWAVVPTQIDLAPFTLPTNACRIYLASTQTGVASATHTKINFDTVDFDADSVSVIGSSRIQPKVPGTYFISAHVDGIGSNTSGLAIFSFALNGTRVTQSFTEVVNTALGDNGLGKSDFIQLNGTTDFIEAQCWLTLTAGTGQFVGGKNFTHLTVSRTGP